MSNQQVNKLKHQLAYMEKRRAFAWAKFYESEMLRLQSAAPVLYILSDYRENGELKEPETLPSHITREYWDMAVRLNKDFTCPICLDIMNKDTFDMTKCGHPLCKDCFEELKETTPLANKVKCPICRKNL
ncbi:hypothetical protein NY2A_B677R [Paramecium bursaria Chlorella virus NY2A]|uniref:Uncharacterized protein B677R n=1 Tax=Paramecium bursaria Chlorella virus NY2A TaxID=46021 RepID=A7IXK2_PBCVN|nr:hypothetical protein NY2A_B677R [Paramecium bursaria Chlorella virus NY2A]ABT15076.1 hypothetical protein NY2A_B677R [Paramecium bursaria Chlorella virus NY2A]